MHDKNRFGLGVSLLAFAAATSISSLAHADAKSCITAHATGQREAKAGHLRLATQLFTTCGSDETCPAQLRRDCLELLQVVEQTVPTIIFSVLDEKGHDVSTVKVFSTDELVVNGLDGRAIQIDPGKHRLRFLLPWGAVLSNDVLIREGEKNRVIQMKLSEAEAENPDAPAPEAKPATPTPVVAPVAPQQLPPSATAPSSLPTAEPARNSGPPLGAWLATGGAVVGIGLGTTFALLGKSKKTDISACAPNCGNEMHPTYDALKRDYLIADIAFAAGALSAGVATWLFLSPRGTESRAAATLSRREPSIVPSGVALPGGGAVAVTGRF